jgi:hypothetical protein
MKKIDISQIVSPTSKQPFTANSLKFKQDYDVENYSALVKALITQSTGSYSLTTPYVISGCVLSDSNKDVTAGEIFYGGNFYNVTSLNGTTNIVQFILTKTYDATADPLTFTDGVAKNVHEIYTYVSTDVASGGDFDATDLDYSLIDTGTAKIYDNIYSAGAFTVNNGVGYDNFTSMTYTTPNDGITRKYIIEYKGYAQTSNGVVDSSCALRIYNTTDSALLDESSVGKSNFGAATEVVIIPVFMSTGVITIAPNKTIKVQGGLSANNISFSKNRMSIVEFR